MATGVTSEVVLIRLCLLTEVAQEAGPRHGVGGWMQAAVVEQQQSSVVLGQDEQPQGLSVHQGVPAPTYLAAAPQQRA